MLQATVQRADEMSTISWRALNEVVLERQQSGHTIWIDVSINDEVFARYSADGLIVSTATGSTAYSMSARGPVMSPRHRAMIVTPVSPHMLFDRSLVLDPHESLHMRVVGTRPVDVAIDGRRVTSLKHDDCVTFEPDYAMAHFIRFEPSSTRSCVLVWETVVRSLSFILKIWEGIDTRSCIVRSVVLTGETGAGKTMLVEAINLPVGGRGCPASVLVPPARIEGRFVDGDSEVVLCRVIPTDGRSRA